MDKISITIDSDDILEEGYEVASFFKKLYRKEEFKLQIDNFFNEFNENSNNGETGGFNDLMKVYAGKEIGSIDTLHLKNGFEKFISDVIGIKFAESTPLSSFSMVASAIEEFTNEMKDKLTAIIELQNDGNASFSTHRPIEDELVKTAPTENTGERKVIHAIPSINDATNLENTPDQISFNTSSNQETIESILGKNIDINQKFFKKIYRLAIKQGQEHVQTETMTLAQFFSKNQSEVVQNFTSLQMLLVQGEQISREFLEKNIDKIKASISGQPILEQDSTPIVEEVEVNIEKNLEKLSSKRESGLTSKIASDLTDVSTFLDDFIHCVKVPLTELPEDKHLIFAIDNLTNSEKKEFFKVLAILIKIHLPYNKVAKKSTSIVANFLAGENISEAPEIRNILSKIENDPSYNPHIGFLKDTIKRIKEIMVYGISQSDIDDSEIKKSTDNITSRILKTKAIIKGEKNFSGENTTGIEYENLEAVREIYTFFKNYTGNKSEKSDAIQHFRNLETFLKTNKESLGLSFTSISKITGIICNFLGFKAPDKEYKYLYTFIKAEGTLHQNLIKELLYKTETILLPSDSNGKTTKSEKILNIPKVGISKKILQNFITVQTKLSKAESYLSENEFSEYLNNFIHKFPQYNLEWLCTNLIQRIGTTEFKKTLTFFYGSLQLGNTAKADYFLEGLIIMLKADNNDNGIITIPNSSYFFNIDRFFDFFLSIKEEYSYSIKSESLDIEGFNLERIKEILDKSKEFPNESHTTNRLFKTNFNNSIGEKYKTIMGGSSNLIVTIISDYNKGYRTYDENREIYESTYLYNGKNKSVQHSGYRKVETPKVLNKEDLKNFTPEKSKTTFSKDNTKEKSLLPRIDRIKESIANKINTEHYINVVDEIKEDIEEEQEESMCDILIGDIESFNPFSDYIEEFLNNILIDFNVLGKNGKNKFKETFGTISKNKIKSSIVLYMLNHFFSNIKNDQQAYESIINLVINEPYLQGKPMIDKFLTSIKYKGEKDEAAFRIFLKSAQEKMIAKEKNPKIDLTTVNGIKQYIKENISSPSSITNANTKFVDDKFNDLPLDEKRSFLKGVLIKKYLINGRLNYNTIGGKLGITLNNKLGDLKNDGKKIGKFIPGSSDRLDISAYTKEQIIKLFIVESL